MAKRRHHLRDIGIVIRRKDRLNSESIGGLTLEDLEITVEPESVAGLNEDIDQMYRGVRAENIKDTIGYQKIKWVKKEDVILNTTELAIAHPFGGGLAFYHVVPHYPAVGGSVPSWYQSQKPDDRAIYLIADGLLTVDVIIRGL